MSLSFPASGFKTFHLVSAASTNATSLKALPGSVFGWQVTNTNSSARKIAFHNTAGTPTAGASVFFSVLVPGSGSSTFVCNEGIAFGTGIAITAVTEAADNGTTGVGAGDLVINIFYN